ncbi:MAG: AMP-binding protein, partial [bacterium]|nr:AMP-binding protein [bacterium]
MNKIPASRSVHTFISGGDVLKSEHVDKLITSAKVYNTYGPTETTVCAAYHQCMDRTKEDMPLGKPIGNYKIFILDQMGRVQPVGVTGELCISGFGVTLGYLNRQELTQEKFISNPFIPGEKLYKSGDLASWLPDGSLKFHGRIDKQIKLRGYRIELGEIECHLLHHYQVKEAVVVATEDEDGDKYLCVYIVPMPKVGDENQPVITLLKKYLSQQLPYYMVPSYFVVMEKFPLTLSGKLNQEALPLPEIKSADKYVPPADGIEMKLVDIWSHVLSIGKDIISVEANFFELGGNSLKTTTLAARIHKTFKVKISLALIFTDPTIRALSAYIKGSEENKYSAIEPAEKREYYSLSSAQKRLYILYQMDLESTAYNMPQFIPLE